MDYTSEMINRQVRQFYIDKENAEHSITDRLIRGGYVQPAGGYILNAKRAGVKDPSQYWHLIYSWSALVLCQDLVQVKMRNFFPF